MIYSEKVIDQMEVQITEQLLEIDELKDRIAELEKTMGERLNDLNTRQVEDARTSLVSTPPYAYAVIEGEDGKENVSLQFDHPEMCGQKYKQSIPLFTTPQIKELSDEEIVRISKTCDLNHVLGLIDFARAILKKASEK